jgi:hypothetical protein
MALFLPVQKAKESSGQHMAGAELRRSDRSPGAGQDLSSPVVRGSQIVECTASYRGSGHAGLHQRGTNRTYAVGTQARIELIHGASRNRHYGRRRGNGAFHLDGFRLELNFARFHGPWRLCLQS